MECVASARKHAALSYYKNGVGTAAIAAALMCSRRRVQQILSNAGAMPEVLPLHDDFQQTVLHEVRRHGPNFGISMLLGALRAHYPACRWPRRQDR